MHQSSPTRPKPGSIRIVLALTAAPLLLPHAAHAATIVDDEESGDTIELTTDVTLSNGASDFRGGAILNASGNILTLRMVRVAGNSAYEGRGIGNYGQLHMVSTTPSAWAATG